MLELIHNIYFLESRVVFLECRYVSLVFHYVMIVYLDQQKLLLRLIDILKR